jgi:membrane protease YdiL (CAAX protease family)
MGEVALTDYAAGGAQCAGVAGLTVAGAAIALGRRSFDPWSLGLLTAGQDLWLYGIYAAYRDARRALGNAGYTQPIPDELFGDLVLAPFSPAAIALEVALPVAAAVGLQLALATFSTGETIFHNASIDTLFGALPPGGALLVHLPAFALIAMAAAVGEEALFRGYFEAGLDEWFGPIAGTIITALLFAAVHLLNPNPGTVADVLVGLGVRGALGAYLGWLFEKDGHRLAKGVAFHFWYDFLLIGGTYVMRPAQVEGLWNFPIPGLPPP